MQNQQPNIFEKETYFNTTREAGKLLATYSGIVKAQDVVVLRFFQANPIKAFSPYQVHEATAKKGTPLTSTRRSMNTLTNEGYLTHSKTKKMGNMGRKTDTWKLKTKDDESIFNSSP